MNKLQLSAFLFFSFIFLSNMFSIINTSNQITSNIKLLENNLKETSLISKKQLELILEKEKIITIQNNTIELQSKLINNLIKENLNN